MGSAPLTVCLVGCGELKRPSPPAHKAKDLYLGTLFRLSRKYAESCDRWFIISAKHELLHPDAVVRSYDLRLPRYRVDREMWGVRVAAQLHQEMDDVDYRYTAVILAGKDYAGPVAEHFARLRVETRMPLAGMMIGERLQWLKTNTPKETVR